MTFIANPLEQFHRRMIETKPQRFALTRPVNLLKFLCQPDDRNFFEAKLFQFRARGIELSFAAINQDEIWQIGQGALSRARRGSLGERALPSLSNRAYRRFTTSAMPAKSSCPSTVLILNRR